MGAVRRRPVFDHGGLAVSQARPRRRWPAQVTRLTVHRCTRCRSRRDACPPAQNYGFPRCHAACRRQTISGQTRNRFVQRRAPPLPRRKEPRDVANQPGPGCGSTSVAMRRGPWPWVSSALKTPSTLSTEVLNRPRCNRWSAVITATIDLSRKSPQEVREPQVLRTGPGLTEQGRETP